MGSILTMLSIKHLFSYLQVLITVSMKREFLVQVYCTQREFDRSHGNGMNLYESSEFLKIIFWRSDTKKFF